jgi:hypothetical protein
MTISTKICQIIRRTMATTTAMQNEKQTPKAKINIYHDQTKLNQWMTHIRRRTSPKCLWLCQNELMKKFQKWDASNDQWQNKWWTREWNNINNRAKGLCENHWSQKRRIVKWNLIICACQTFGEGVNSMIAPFKLIQWSSERMIYLQTDSILFFCCLSLSLKKKIFRKTINLKTVRDIPCCDIDWHSSHSIDEDMSSRKPKRFHVLGITMSGDLRGRFSALLKFYQINHDQNSQCFKSCEKPYPGLLHSKQPVQLLCFRTTNSNLLVRRDLDNHIIRICSWFVNEHLGADFRKHPVYHGQEEVISND